MTTRQRVELKRKANRYDWLEKWVIVPAMTILVMLLCGWVERL